MTDQENEIRTAALQPGPTAAGDGARGFFVEPVSDGELDERYRRLEAAGAAYPGFLPNSMRIMARDEELFDAVADVAQLVMFRDGRVDAGLKWLVGHVVSAAAGCRYCTAHTATIGAERSSVSLDRLEAVWEFETSELFSDADRAALRLAAAAGQVPNAVEASHMQDLKRHYDDDQIVEIASVIALYGFFNRWNDTLATPLEAPVRTFGDQHLRQMGWQPGKHRPVDEG